MYQLGRRSRHHKLLMAALAGVVVLVFSYGIYRLITLDTSPRTQIKNAPGTITHYNPDAGKMIHISTSKFTMDLPAGWKTLSPTSNIYHGLRYQSGKPGTQLLTVYIDTLPVHMAVNRVLSVQAQGDQISHDTVSDNCINFLPPSLLNTQQAQITKVVDAKWQGVEFYCDIGNYERDVVGTSSPDGINKVILSGATTGTHAVFFTFTDNDISPDFSTFYAILESFKLK